MLFLSLNGASRKVYPGEGPCSPAMPITLLHYSLAYLMRKVSKKMGVELDMAGLAIGSFIPDAECLAFFSLLWAGFLDQSKPYVEAKRLILHSVLGSLTLGALISMPIVIALYRLFGRARYGLVRPSLTNLYISSALGALSHVLLDALHHHYNPLLFPFTWDSINVLVPFGDYQLGTIVAYSIAVSLCVAALVIERSAGRDIFIKLLFDA